MGDMGIRDELKGGTGVGWCELVGYCACDEVHTHYTHARGIMDLFLILYIFNHKERK